MKMLIGMVKVDFSEKQHGYLKVDGLAEDISYRHENGYDVLDFPSYFEPSFNERLWVPGCGDPSLIIPRGKELIFELDYSRWGKPIAYRWAYKFDWVTAEYAIRKRIYRVTRVVTRGGQEEEPYIVWSGRNLRDAIKRFPIVVTNPTGNPFKDNPLIPYWQDPARGFTVRHEWQVLWHGEWLKLSEDPRHEFARFNSLLSSEPVLSTA